MKLNLYTNIRCFHSILKDRACERIKGNISLTASKQFGSVGHF